MNRTNVINTLINRHGYRSYLEIGVRNPRDNFDLVECRYKEGVDPAVSDPRVHRMTSNEWFDVDGRRYDIIFIDGDHRYAGACDDLLRWPTRCDGHVVVHDCLPKSEDATGDVKPNTGRGWNGNVWKAWVEFRHTRPFLTYTVDCDHGLGIIDVMRQAEPPRPQWTGELTYSFWMAHRAELCAVRRAV